MSRRYAPPMPADPRRVRRAGEGSGADVADVMFLRDFRRFSGGHLKVWHYFNHVLSSPRHRPWIRFSEQSVWDDSNPWRHCRERVVGTRSRVRPSVFVLAGTDWLRLTRQECRRRRPVVNLVQHVRHADPDDVRYSFLERPAVRICVSPEVAGAIAATGRVNGPVVTIPNAVVVDEVDTNPAPPRDIDVLVVADKDPVLGRRVHERLRQPGRELRVVDRLIPRRRFLGLLRQARVSVFLPGSTEGFYLPALEGMALGTLVVCADCVGNRSFCLPGHNCFRPDREEDRLVKDVEEALHLPGDRFEQLLHNARATAAAHDPAAERAAFLRVLDDVEQLWERI